MVTGILKVGEVVKVMKENRDLVYGIGINDIPYQLNEKNKYYEKWMSMLERCYSGKYKTYIGVTVCDEWLTFSNFKNWMEGQVWEGLEIDKDILCHGNMIYAPDKCCFVSSRLNSLFTRRVLVNREYPRGVSYHKKQKLLRATITIDGESIHLGTFDTVVEAEESYIKARIAHIKEFVELEKDQAIIQGLLKHIDILIERIDDGNS